MLIKNFPRGGQISSKKSSNKFYKWVTINKKKQKKNDKFKDISILEDTSVISNGAGNLKFSSLCKGMIILGRILKITEYYAIVSIPGQLKGKFQTTDISKNYTNLLRTVANNKGILNDLRPISDLYKEGDYVVCYVKEVYSNLKRVSLSLEPNLLNQKLNPKVLTKHSKLVLTISSVEDYGYVLETGLKNLSAFLSIKDVENKYNNFYPGKQIMCTVKELITNENIFTVKVSVKYNINNFETNFESLDNLYPGVRYLLKIKQILNNGLEVYFDKNNIGYINESYLQNDLSFFEIGQELVGVLLYIIPNVNLSYFSLVSQEQERKLLKIGELISNVRVMYYTKKGVFVQLEKEVRGFIPLKNEKKFGKIDIFNKSSFFKCKIIAYDFIAKLYMCTVENKTMDKKLGNLNLQPGDVVEVKIIKINNNSGYITVLVGKLYGFVPPDQVLDPGSMNKLKIGNKVKARVLEFSSKLILTLKRTIIESALPILSKIEDAIVGLLYHGTVIKITKHGVLVRFFNNLKGWIPAHLLSHQTESEHWNLYFGQTVTIEIKRVNINNNKITLKLSNNQKINELKYIIGDVVEGTVIDSSEEGLYLQLRKDSNEDITAFLPAAHMSLCNQVGKLLASKTVVGDVLSAIVFSNNPNIILSTTIAPEVGYTIDDLKPGDCILCSVKELQKDSVKVILPIVKYANYGTIPISNVEQVEFIHEYQILLSKITKINQKTQELTLSTELHKVWKSVSEYEVKMMTAIDILSSYLAKLSELSRNIYYANQPISKISIAQRIKGTIQNITDNGLLVKLEGNIKGIVHLKHYLRNYNEGDEVEGSVLWINYHDECVVLTLLNNAMNNITIKQNKLIKIPLGIQLRGEILLITDWFILVLLKGQVKGTLAALPVRKHLNDTVPDLIPYNIGDKVRCYCMLNKEDADILLPICMLKSVFEVHQHTALSIKHKADMVTNETNLLRVKKLKKFENNNLDVKRIKEITISKESKRHQNNIKEETEISSKLEQEHKYKNKSNEDLNIFNKNFNNLIIPECGFKWSNINNTEIYLQHDSSTSDEEEEGNFIKSNENKLLCIQKTKSQKENKIFECERGLIKFYMPETEDQFDRLLLSSSNSSIVWIQYMSYHLRVTDIDRARAIAKRALKVINFSEENEILNIWQAWLNLESRFGSQESLNEIFQEAIKMNDITKIYSHMLLVHSDAGRQSELEKIVTIMITKFNKNFEVWINCGNALLKACMKNKSRHIMQRALQSLPVNKHIDVLIGFAQLESKFGDPEQSQILFEQVLNTYPKRMDIWCCYLDSMMRSGNMKITRFGIDKLLE